MPRDDYAKARSKQIGRRALATGNYFGGKRENDTREARQKQRWKNKIAADKKLERERAKVAIESSPKPSSIQQPSPASLVTLVYIICRKCSRKYTSMNPPPRPGGKMRCHCGGRVCLEHQLGIVLP
jgi:hypothetical protein